MTKQATGLRDAGATPSISSSHIPHESIIRVQSGSMDRWAFSKSSSHEEGLRCWKKCQGTFGQPDRQSSTSPLFIFSQQPVRVSWLFLALPKHLYSLTVKLYVPYDLILMSSVGGRREKAVTYQTGMGLHWQGPSMDGQPIVWRWKDAYKRGITIPFLPIWKMLLL